MEKTFDDMWDEVCESKPMLALDKYFAYLPPILMWPLAVPLAVFVLLGTAVCYYGRHGGRALFVPEAFR